MRILYVSQFFPPESIAGAFRADEHARRWSDLGHDVTVLTGWPNYPKGRVFDGYDVELLGESSDRGVRVLRSKLVAKPNTSLIRRIANGASFMFFGCLNVVFNGRKVGRDYDIVLASSGTVFAAYVGLLHSRLSHTPFVVEFRDITFEQMVATGTPRDSWKVLLMRSLELHLAKSAAKVIVLTAGFKDKLAECGVPAQKVEVVPNGADVVDVERIPDDGVVRLGYFGTMGISQDVPTTLEIAEKIGELSGAPVRYDLVGEGTARADVERELEGGRYPFAALHHGVPKDELEARYADCDLTFVSLQRSPAFEATVPSKIFQSFARGVPVVFVGPEGEASRLVEKCGGGLTLCSDESENGRTLSAFFADDDWRSRLSEMGRRAQETMARDFSRAVLAERMLEVIEDASKAKGTAKDD